MPTSVLHHIVWAFCHIFTHTHTAQRRETKPKTPHPISSNLILLLLFVNQIYFRFLENEKVNPSVSNCMLTKPWTRIKMIFLCFLIEIYQKKKKNLFDWSRGNVLREGRGFSGGSNGVSLRFVLEILDVPVRRWKSLKVSN